MAVAKTLRTTVHGHPIAQVSGKDDRRSDFGFPNMGSADVRAGSQTRAHAAPTQVITLGSFGGTDSFKIRVIYPNPEANANGFEDTAAIVRGTNAAATDLKTALENLDGIVTATVSGTTDAGPYTVTLTADAAMNNSGTTDQRFRGLGVRLALVTLSGCSGHVTTSDPTYVSSKGLPGEVHKHGTDTGVSTASFPGIKSGDDVPLGRSIYAVGFAHADLPAPVFTSAIGGSGTVAIVSTLDATHASCVLVITNTLTGKVVSIQTDADGSVAATTLVAGNYYVVCFGVTTAGRVSESSPREYFTVT